MNKEDYKEGVEYPFFVLVRREESRQPPRVTQFEGALIWRTMNYDAYFIKKVLSGRQDVN